MIDIRILAVMALALLQSSPGLAERVAVVNARILTQSAQGDIPSGSIVMRNHLIEAVGAHLDIPSDARVIDAQGAMVTPGFVAASTAVTVADLWGGDGLYDLAASTDAFSSAYDISHLINPWSIVTPVIRASGITRAFLTPDYSGTDRQWPFAGQTAVVQLGQSGETLVRRGAAMVLQLRSGTPRSPEYPPQRAGLALGSVFAALTVAFDEARRYARAGSRWQPLHADIKGLTRADIEALVPVVNRKMPLIVRVNKAAHIQEVLAFAQQQQLRIVLLGAQEGWRVAKQIAAANVAVILDPMMTLPATMDTLASRPENAALLVAAGVSIAFVGPNHMQRVREIRTNAAMAVAYGLPFDAALRALTINPAQMFDSADRFGSLEPGKDADVVIWSGDPLQPLSWPTAVFIRGQQQSFESRQQLLRERYQDR